MLFLDLDLDFFLNKNVYYSGYDGSRPGQDFKPWTPSRVRRFLVERCGLSPENKIPGRTVATHDGVLEFWRSLINSGNLKIPFDVVHIDAHPDLFVGDVLHLRSDYIRIDVPRSLPILEKKPVHAGNYLTFALAYGWIHSLVWVPLFEHRPEQKQWDADARLALKTYDKDSSIPDSPPAASERRISFKILPWNRFHTPAPFDYMALSKSPDFTPPESDKLISVIEEYIKQI